IKSVKHVVGSIYSRNKTTFLSHGFDYDDVLNIGKFLGLLWTATKIGPNTVVTNEYDKHIILMHFLTQKLNLFMNRINRKFQVTNNLSNEVGVEGNLLETLTADERVLNNPENAVALADDKPEVSPADQLDLDMKQLNVVEQDLSGIKNLLADKPINREDLAIRKRRKETKRRILSKRVDALRGALATEKSSKRTYSRTLKKELTKNLPAYKDKLAYCAVSGDVGFDVRKAARKMCKKYGIEYLEWAKAYIAAHPTVEHGFVLR
ncbi:MAG: hypothetical protein ACREGB_01630, partial [Candidatus Saccharimonadales bacterium]